MLHASVTPFLIWCIAGACQWVVLDGLGVISGGVALRIARGRKPSLLLMVLASIAAIAIWPVFTWKVLRHPKWAAKTLARNLWGRP